MGKKTGGFLLGAFIGSVAAATTALLFAPKSGKELREDLAVKADELKEQLSDYVDISIEKGVELSEVALNATEDIRVNLKDSASQLKDTVTKSAINLKEEVSQTVSKVQDTFSAKKEEAEEVVAELKEEVNA